VTSLPDPESSPPLEFDAARLEGIPAFLAVAEAFRKLGESIVAHGQKIPVLDPAETWCSPQDLALPQIEIDLPPLSADVLALLAARRAPRRSY
jgi:hypothetical protein